jgi:hypothetical protein
MCFQRRNSGRGELHKPEREVPRGAPELAFSARSTDPDCHERYAPKHKSSKRLFCWCARAGHQKLLGERKFRFQFG